MPFPETALPAAPLEDTRATKILATVGPAVQSRDKLLSLVEAGADGLRINASHIRPETYETAHDFVIWAKEIEEQLERPIPIVWDLGGPKFRLGSFVGARAVEADQVIQLGYGDYDATDGIFPVQHNIAPFVRPGEPILFWDGKVESIVERVDADGFVHTRVLNGGELQANKGMNFPDTNFRGNVITDKDRQDLEYASHLGHIAYVAESFTQVPSDVTQLVDLKNAYGMQDTRVIAKIETPSAILPENLGPIVIAADGGIMVARGDLGVETPIENIPAVQRRLLAAARWHGRLSIAATQKMMSMMSATRPTHAEVADIDASVRDGAHACMLSEETAMGNHPALVVSTMARVIRATERAMREEGEGSEFGPRLDPSDRSTTHAIADGIVAAAKVHGARIIAVETRTGNTALQVVSEAPDSPVLAVTSSHLTAQQLGIVRGVRAFVRPDNPDGAARFIHELAQSGLLTEGDRYATTKGTKPGYAGTTNNITLGSIGAAA